MSGECDNYGRREFISPFVDFLVNSEYEYQAESQFEEAFKAPDLWRQRFRR